MKHTTSLPRKDARETCIDCGMSASKALMRVVGADPLEVKCQNEAACRKRQRQRAKTKHAPTGRRYYP